MSFPGSPAFESDASRVAADLNVGNAQDAANVLRGEIFSDPRHAGELIQRANSESAPNRRDDILVDRAGDVAIRDRATGFETPVADGVHRLPGGFFPPVIIVGGWEWGHGHGHRPFPFPHPGHRHF